MQIEFKIFLSIASNAKKSLCCKSKAMGYFTIDYKADVLKKISISNDQIEIKNFHEIFIYNDNIFLFMKTMFILQKENDLKFSKVK